VLGNPGHAIEEGVVEAQRALHADHAGGAHPVCEPGEAGPAQRRVPSTAQIEALTDPVGDVVDRPCARLQTAIRLELGKGRRGGEELGVGGQDSGLSRLAREQHRVGVWIEHHRPAPADPAEDSGETRVQPRRGDSLVCPGGGVDDRRLKGAVGSDPGSLCARRQRQRSGERGGDRPCSDPAPHRSV
jgi:hypothetical protein